MNQSQQVLNFKNTKKVVVNDNRTSKPKRNPELQDKGVVKPVRFEPDRVDNIKDVCFEENMNFSEFVRDSTEIGEDYIKYKDTMLGPDKNLIIQFIQRLSKNF